MFFEKLTREKFWQIFCIIFLLGKCIQLTKMQLVLKKVEKRFASQLSHFSSKKKLNCVRESWFASRVTLIVSLRWKGHKKVSLRRRENFQSQKKDLIEDALILLSPFVVWREKIISAKSCDEDQLASVIRCWQLQH